MKARRNRSHREMWSRWEMGALVMKCFLSFWTQQNCFSNCFASQKMKMIYRLIFGYILACSDIHVNIVFDCEEDQRDVCVRF